MWEYVFEPEVIKSPPPQVNGHAESSEGNAKILSILQTKEKLIYITINHDIMKCKLVISIH